MTSRSGLVNVADAKVAPMFVAALETGMASGTVILMDSGARIGIVGLTPDQVEDILWPPATDEGLSPGQYKP